MYQVEGLPSVAQIGRGKGLFYRKIDEANT